MIVFLIIIILVMSFVYLYFTESDVKYVYDQELDDYQSSLMFFGKTKNDPEIKL